MNLWQGKNIPGSLFPKISMSMKPSSVQNFRKAFYVNAQSWICLCWHNMTSKTQFAGEDDEFRPPRSILPFRQFINDNSIESAFQSHPSPLLGVVLNHYYSHKIAFSILLHYFNVTMISVYAQSVHNYSGSSRMLEPWRYLDQFHSILLLS